MNKKNLEDLDLTQGVVVYVPNGGNPHGTHVFKDGKFVTGIQNIHVFGTADDRVMVTVTQLERDQEGNLKRVHSKNINGDAMYADRDGNKIIVKKVREKIKGVGEVEGYKPPKGYEPVMKMATETYDLAQFPDRNKTKEETKHGDSTIS